MAQALPLTKLAGLMIKTLSKPLSKQIKHQLSRYDAGQRLLRGIGQSVHGITSRMTIWSAGYKVRSIHRLDDDKALKEGSEFVGEAIIFCISGGWVLYEYNQAQDKYAAKQEAKRAAAAAERAELRTQLHAIDARLQALESALQKNQWLLGVSYQAPPEKHQVLIAPPLSFEEKEDEALQMQLTKLANKKKTDANVDPDDRDKKYNSSSQSAPQQRANDNKNGWVRWIWPF